MHSIWDQNLMPAQASHLESHGIQRQEAYWILLLSWWGAFARMWTRLWRAEKTARWEVFLQFCERLSIITKCSLHPTEILGKQIFTSIISTYYPECYLSIWPCVCICGSNLNHWLTNSSILRYGGTGKNWEKSLFKNNTKSRRVAYKPRADEQKVIVF